VNRSVLVMLAVVFASGGVLRAQSNPVSASLKADYVTVRDFVIRSAEEMPEGDYGFKPTPAIRSFGQLVAHVADDQYNLCAPVKGETRKAAYAELESSLTAKNDLVAALKQAFAYCDGAYESMTDASAQQIVKFGSSDQSKFHMLNWNIWHTWEHYGNLVVYLRMKGLVPPSSQRR
jgi:uncharacterized damage-inducible protein DinB